jgi:hypothetical protein
LDILFDTLETGPDRLDNNIHNNNRSKMLGATSNSRTNDVRNSPEDELTSDVPQLSRLDGTQGEESTRNPLDDNGDEEDDITVIMLDQTIEDGNDRVGVFSEYWIEQHGPEMEERRRNILLRELKRVQRASFIHFALLCFIPTALLIVVLITIFSGDEECESSATYCALEERTFVHAFTTRCVCDPIPIARTEVP